MTDKEFNKLAEQIADIIIEKLEAKQKQWDQEFYEANPDMYFIHEADDEQSKKEILKEELKALENLLKKYTDDEDFLKAGDIYKRIIKLKKQIEKL